MPDGVLGPPSSGVTLGRRVGLTDQYLRVWRLFLFNRGAAANMLQTQAASGAGNGFGPGGTAAPVGEGIGELVFTSESPTGQDPGILLHAAGLRIHFIVNQTVNSTPNNAEITLYNLDDKKSSDLIRESNYVILQAGYLFGQAGTIFTGSIKMFKRGKENVTDSYLRIYAADGDMAINNAQINTTLPEGTSPEDHLMTLFNTMESWDISVGRIDQEAFAKAVPEMSDVVKYGMTADHLRDFSQQNGAVWHILDQRFYFTAPASYDPGAIVVLTGATGLIGFPEITQDGLNVTCLINPAMRLRQRLKLDNKSIQQYFQPAASGYAPGWYNWVASDSVIYNMPVQQDGIYVPVVINYEGDSRGQPWYQYMICLAVDESKDPLSAVFGALDWSFI